MNALQQRANPPTSLSLKPAIELFRRVSDIALAVLAICLLWPLLLAIALAVALDSPGPVLFRQERLGRGGKTFVLLKFRTMHPSAEAQLAEILASVQAHGQVWTQYQKLRDDPRTTALGVFLRRFSLDELPQILNVLRGDMSFVGPRPILPDQRSLYGAAFAGYALVRPGLTGLWQVSGRNLTSFAERVDWDQIYLARRSLALDAAILVRTIGVVVRGEGAY